MQGALLEFEKNWYLKQGQWVNCEIFNTILDDKFKKLCDNPEWWVTNRLRNRNVKWNELLIGQVIGNFQIFIQKFGDIHFFEYVLIKNVFIDMFNKHGISLTKVCPYNYILRNKGGCKRLRAKFKLSSDSILSNLSKDKTVKNLVLELKVEINEHTPKVYALWLKEKFDNKLADFVYKLLNNKLMVRSRESHFKDVSYACSYCELHINSVIYAGMRRNALGESEGPITLEKEKYNHLFFTCIYIKKFWNILFPGKGEDEIKKNLFCEKDPDFKILCFVILECIYFYKGKDYHVSSVSIKEWLSRRLRRFRLSYDNQNLRNYQLRLNN